MILCCAHCQKNERKETKMAIHFTFVCEPFVFVLAGNVHSWRKIQFQASRSCHHVYILGETVIDRVTHLGSTPVPRTIILNTILAVSKLQGTSCKVRNLLSWRFVYFAVNRGKGVLCEPFAWNLNV
jgi:hypothetical protein